MASKAHPLTTSKRLYPNPTHGGTPTCTERFPNLLVHTILGEWIGISRDLLGMIFLKNHRALNQVLGSPVIVTPATCKIHN